MANYKNLHGAKRNKRDEFYTVLSDIENEIKHYANYYFQDKIVLCNCNDGFSSQFWCYFHTHFKEKGLKKLIGIKYGVTEQEQGEAHIYSGGADTDIKSCEVIKLQGRGDFQDAECIKYLEEADVVVTNPPFSLFQTYFGQLIEYGKKFLIVGSQNAITYKKVFYQLKNNAVWLGYGFKGNVGFFSNTLYMDYAKSREHKEGMIRVSGVMWFTNMVHDKIQEKIELTCKYTPEKYPLYGNYNAIEVSKTAEIPMDYEGVMGVPITFLTKYNPLQFEIMGINTGRAEYECRPTKKYINPILHRKDGTEESGVQANSRSSLEVTEGYSGAYYTADNTDKPFTLTYARIFIRRKREQGLRNSI